MIKKIITKMKSKTSAAKTMETKTTATKVNGYVGIAPTAAVGNLVVLSTLYGRMNFGRRGRRGIGIE